MAENNYRTGAYVSPFAWDKNRDWDITRSNLKAHQILRGTLDWDSLENVQGHIADLKYIRKISASKERYFADNPDKDTQLGKHKTNVFYGQGLGPKTFSGSYWSDLVAVESQWWEATERKFLLREEELKGIANAPASAEFGAGTQGAYAAQQTAREGLGKPFAEGARAAELLRQDRGPRTGGGAAQRGAGRQASRARVAEGRRLASRDRTSGSGSGGGGGGGGLRRLRAANLLRQPLGAGNQLSAQVLG